MCWSCQDGSWVCASAWMRTHHPVRTLREQQAAPRYARSPARGDGHTHRGILIRCILWSLPVNLHKHFLSKLTLGTVLSLHCSNSQRITLNKTFLLRNIMTEFLVCFNWCNGEQPPPKRRRRLDRNMIGEPMNFVHTAHIGAREMSSDYSSAVSIQDHMKSKGGYTNGTSATVEI